MSTDNDLFNAALALPLTVRAELAQRLIESLDDREPDPDAPDAWAAEIESRIEAYHRGELKAQPWRDAIEEVRNALRPDES